MKIWKIILGFLGLVGGLFAAGAAKNKEVKKIVKETLFSNDGRRKFEGLSY